MCIRDSPPPSSLLPPASFLLLPFPSLLLPSSSSVPAHCWRGEKGLSRYEMSSGTERGTIMLP
eukprot:3239485-Rhodomonas_salina.1